MIKDNDKPIRLLVMSDAIPERNGVGSYYADLIQQVSPFVECAELIYPMCKRTAGHSYLTAPLPGDGTQAIQVPKPGHLVSEFKSIRPNVIIVPTPGPYGMAGLYLARRYKLPLITGFHTHYEALTDLYWNRVTGTLARGFLSSCNRLIFRYSHTVLANSPEMCKQAELTGAKHVELMGTSVAADFVNTPLSQLNIEVKSVLFAGRLAKEKNIDAIIDAAKIHKDIRFTIAGDGPLKSSIEKATESLSNVSVLGWVPRKDLIEVIDEHDVLLLPSHVESFGTVALEGMARGKIVIVSHNCGLVEWDGLSSAAVQIAESETAADTLKRVCAASSQWRFEIGESAALAARKINDWNTTFWLKTLKNCIDEGKPGVGGDQELIQPFDGRKSLPANKDSIAS